MLTQDDMLFHTVQSPVLRGIEDEARTPQADTRRASRQASWPWFIFPNVWLTALSLRADFRFFPSPQINTARLFALSKHIFFFVKSETFPAGFSQREWSCQSSSRASARSHFHLSPPLWFCRRLYCKECWKIDNCIYYNLSLFSSLCCVMLFWSNLTKGRCIKQSKQRENHDKWKHLKVGHPGKSVRSGHILKSQPIPFCGHRWRHSTGIARDILHCHPPDWSLTFP